MQPGSSISASELRERGFSRDGSFPLCPRADRWPRPRLDWPRSTQGTSRHGLLHAVVEKGSFEDLRATVSSPPGCLGDPARRKSQLKAIPLGDLHRLQDLSAIHLHENLSPLIIYILETPVRRCQLHKVTRCCSISTWPQQPTISTEPKMSYSGDRASPGCLNASKAC